MPSAPGLNAVKCGYVPAGLLAEIAATLIVPPLRLPLDMPAHDLNPPLAARCASLIEASRKMAQTFKLMKRRDEALLRNR